MSYNRVDIRRTFDFRIFFQPACAGMKGTGSGTINGPRGVLIQADQSPNLFPSKEACVHGYSQVVLHELGHTFGAGHDTCFDDTHRGSVAWCDFEAPASSTSICDETKTPGYIEYCSPFGIMGGSPDPTGLSDWTKTKAFTMDAKIVFNWVDRANYPKLVSTIDWDPSMSGYPSCILTCTFLLQRSDAATLNASAPAVIFLQAKHPSLDGGGNRYFVMEHRYVLTPRRFGASRDANSNPNVPVLTVHLRDIDPTGGSPGNWKGVSPGAQSPTDSSLRTRPLGDSILTDCTPETPSWDDAGCTLGSSIILDTGSAATSVLEPAAPVKMRVNISKALESGRLRVTITRLSTASTAPRPSFKPTPRPSPPPSPSPPPPPSPPLEPMPPLEPKTGMLKWVEKVVSIICYGIALLACYFWRSCRSRPRFIGRPDESTALHPYSPAIQQEVEMH